MSRHLYQNEAENVIGHMMHFLSNEPDRTGISPRMRLYGTLPLESSLITGVDDDVILGAVKRMLEAQRAQTNPLPDKSNSWRTYS